MTDKVTNIRDAKGRFPKGVSGNPSGVSVTQAAIKELEIVQRKVLSGQFVAMVPAARKALKGLLVKKNISDDNLIKVVSLVLSYGIGKPGASLPVDDVNEESVVDTASMDRETRKAIIEKLKAQDAADDE